MKHFLSFLLAHSVLLFWPAAFSQEACQKWTPSQWDEFIDKEIVGIFIDKASSYEELENIDILTKKCQSRLKNPAIGGCMKRIQGYFRQINIDNAAGPDHRVYSGYLTDKQYMARFKEAPAEANTLPVEFAMASRGLPDNWQQIAKDKGWKWVLFNSKTSSGRERRLVFYIPGQKYNRFLLFWAMDGSPPKAADFVNVQMESIENVSPQQPAKIYFSTFHFDGPKEQPRLAYPDHEELRCVRCHTSGARALEVKDKPDFLTSMGGVANVQEFNDFAAADKLLDYSLYYDEKTFPSHLPIGQSSGCTDCHGEKRNSLAYLPDTSLLQQKVVRDKTMPFHNKFPLSDAQRSILLDELTKDYKYQLTQWLTETKCAGPSKNPEPLKPAEATE